MASLHVDIAAIEWVSGVPFYGPGAVHDGKDIVQLKILSDRRREGGGITWLVRFLPPPDKLIKIVAVALSDEHVFSLEGGRTTKSGQPARGASDYGLNTRGQLHSAMIGQIDAGSVFPSLTSRNLAGSRASARDPTPPICAVRKQEGTSVSRDRRCRVRRHPSSR